MRKFIGMTEPWRPASWGEHLLFLLLEHNTELQRVRDALDGLDVSFCNRSGDFADFYVGAAVANALQRIVHLGADVREQYELRDKQTDALRSLLASQVGITPYTYRDDLHRFADVALRCAEVAARNVVPASLNKELGRDGGSTCYSCGNPFGIPLPNGTIRARTADHVWPASLGGETEIRNLLSACADCNNRKQHLAVWQMAWVQAQVFSFTSWTSARETIPLQVKMALHHRAAFEYAHANGTTLKDAFLALGPREDPVSWISEDTGLDFFNMRVHDEARTSVMWTAQ